MKKVTLILSLLFAVSTAYSLPDFWYSGIAYNTSGQIITSGPLAQVDVTIDDGINSATQTFFNVPVDAFGVYTVHITGAGALTMKAGTQITVQVNGVIVSGESLSQWFIVNNILPAGGTTTDQTVDAWINNLPQTRVELGTLSDGTTARPLGTEFVILDNGKVGIGTDNPLGQLGVSSASVTGVYSSSAGSHGFWGLTATMSGAGLLGDNSAGGEAVVGRTNGAVGVGAVVGRNDGAGYGVRGFNTSNGIGVLGQGGSNGGTSIAGRFENLNSDNTSNTLEVSSNSAGRGIYVSQTGTGTGVYSTSDGSHGLWGLTATISGAGVLGDNSGGGEAVVGRTNGAVGVGAVVGRNDGAGYGVRGFNTSNGIGVLGQGGSNGGTSIAGRFENLNSANTSNTLEVSSNSPGRGIYVSQTGTGTGVYSSSAESHGLWGLTATMSGAGVLGDNSAGGEAVVGRTNGGIGVGAVVGRNDGAGYGVRGFNTSTGIGVLGQAGTSGGTGVAGRFENVNAANTSDALQVVTNSSGNAASFTGNVVITGNLDVSGTVAKGGGSFVIDHPLDPLNKKLFHSFVESPDMKNIYDGNVVLNRLGEAVITLPDWFSAVNGDFRYQLTAIGGPGAGLYIAEEIRNNQFKIAGGTAGLKVSWQVTGIRKDVWAEKNRIQVEVDKNDKEKGSYIHPDAFGVVIPQNVNINTIQQVDANLISNQPLNKQIQNENEIDKSSVQPVDVNLISNQPKEKEVLLNNNSEQNLQLNMPKEIPSNQELNNQNNEKSKK